MSGDSLNNAPANVAKPALGGHGHDNRGLEAGSIPGMGYGRFGRMFPFSGRPLTDDLLVAIADVMIKVDVSKPIDEEEPIDENPTVSSGYTYFGQFVDHDLTLDPSPISVDRLDVAALEDFRTPALDLDCVYGRGPDDQPYMYHADGLRLREGKPLTAGTAKGLPDLPRVPAATGDNPNVQRAVIGDKRNDENRIVAQFQSAMIHLHNKIVMDDALVGQFGGDVTDSTSRFRAAVNILRWHYQWLVLHDYLDKRILKPGTIAKVMPGGVPALRFYVLPAATFAYIPVEFAGAAFRFGHSMVRPGYALNSAILKGAATPGAAEQDGRVAIFSTGADPTENLNGFGMPMPPTWGIDWSFFFDVSRSHLPAGNAFKLPQPSYRMDAMLVSPLMTLPEFSAEVESKLKNLAYRNLRRGCNVLSLPSGEQVAHAIGVAPLTPAQLWQSHGSGKPTPTLPEDDDAFVTALLNKRSALWAKPAWQAQLNGNTPLWYYVLREAELLGVEHAPGDPMIGFGGQHLGPVGSTIIAETFVGLLIRDPNSYLNRWPQFEPVLPKRGATFTVGDLLAFATA
jgi:hypothetical protein